MSVKIITLNPKKLKKPIEYIEHNRPIDKSMVKKLKTSMDKYGILSALTIYEAEDKFLIVDGQHRWSAAKSLGLSIPAIVITWDALTAIVEMNTIQKNWTMHNYVDFYCAHNDPTIKKTYTILKGLNKKHEHLNYSSLVRIYCNPRGQERFKQGLCRINKSDLQKGDAFVQQLIDIGEYYDFYFNRRFIDCFVDIAYHSDYDHQRMLRKMQKNHGVEIMSATSSKSYGVALTKIYNHQQKTNLVMFKARWIA